MTKLFEISEAARAVDPAASVGARQIDEHHAEFSFYMADRTYTVTAPTQRKAMEMGLELIRGLKPAPASSHTFTLRDDYTMQFSNDLPSCLLSTLLSKASLTPGTYDYSDIAGWVKREVVK